MFKLAHVLVADHMPISAVGQAWRGPFLQHKLHKHTQLTQATSLCEQRLQRQAMSAWQAAVAAGHAESSQQSAADQHLRHQRLQWTLKAWVKRHQQAQEEKQQLIIAAQPIVEALQRRLQRRILRNWRQVQAQQQRDQQMVG